MKNKIEKISGLSYINWTWQQYNNVALRSVITNVFAKVGNNTYLYKDYMFKMEGKNYNNNKNNTNNKNYCLRKIRKKRTEELLERLLSYF